MKHFEQS